MNTTFLHFCALHCPYCLPLLVSVSCSVLPFTNITVPVHLKLPGYSTLGKLMHSNIAAPCCYSKVALLKRFTFSSCMVSQMYPYLERNQRNKFQYYNLAFLNFTDIITNPILVLTRKTLISTKQDTNSERRN